jgi:hypothetical protein
LILHPPAQLHIVPELAPGAAKGDFMKRIAILCCALALLGLSGCATDYGSQGLTGGYDQKQIEQGVWRVSFAGNGFTTAETVQTFWLYRCAEIALENGADGFEIISNIHLTALQLHPGEDARLIPVHGGGYVYIPMYMPDVPKPSMVADIRLLKKPFTAVAPKSFDAAALKAALEPIVKGKLCDSGNVCPHEHAYLRPQSA